MKIEIDELTAAEYQELATATNIRIGALKDLIKTMPGTEVEANAHISLGSLLNARRKLGMM